MTEESAPGDVVPGPAVPAAEEPNSWESRRGRAAGHLIPWIEQTVSLTGKTVLEYGCGNAPVSCAFAPRAGRLIGVDVDPEVIDYGRSALSARGIANVELELHPLAGILDAVAARRGQIDVFLCYAVLEHLTLEERLSVLRLAREVVKPDGVIVVCETPNRLTAFDHHTAQMPFFHLLPDELALQYFRRSGREDFLAAIDGAVARGHEAALQAIVRWGRGVSFHEFELVFGDLSSHVLASSYDPLLFAERPIHAEELVLARELERWRPDLAPAWSRRWLDLILSPVPVARRPSFLRPWTVETVQSPGASVTRWGTVRLPGPETPLWVSLSHPTQRIVVGATGAGGPLALRARAETMAAPVLARAHGRRQEPGRGGDTELEPRYVSFDLPVRSQRIELGASAACELVFVGYED